MGANKVILNDEVIVDLTQDTVTENDVAAGKTFHKKDGTVAVGVATWDGIPVNGEVVSKAVVTGKTVKEGDFVELITGGYATTHIDTVGSERFLATLLNENTIFVAYGRSTNSNVWDEIYIYSLTNNSWDRRRYDVEEMMNDLNPNRAICRVSDTRAVTVLSSYDTKGYDVVTGWEVGDGTPKQTNWETSKDGKNKWDNIVPYRVNDSCVAIFHDEKDSDGDGGYKRTFKGDIFIFDSSSGFKHWDTVSFWGTVSDTTYSCPLRACAINETKFACVFTGKKGDGTVKDYLARIRIENNTAVLEKSIILDYIPLETNTSSFQASFIVSDGGDTLYYTHGNYVCSIDVSLDKSTFKELGVLSPTYGGGTGAFFIDGRLILFSPDAATSFTVPDIAHEDTFAFPHTSSSGKYIALRQTSPNIFTVINPRDGYVMQVQVDNGRFKEAGNASGTVQPAQSAKFIYGVAASDGAEGQYVDIIVPKLGENL